jgi:NADPH2:quinone reductase
MKAVVIEAFGNMDQMKLKEIRTPEPREDEVLVKVAYAGVNPVDWKIRAGMLQNRLPHQFPIIPGWDAAGTVAKAGKKVTEWKVGDEVYAYCRKPTVQWGAYAEYIALPQESLARKPGNLTLREAAVFPLAALTAWQSLFDVLKLTKGESILVHAGAGGVGGFAIQFAKWAGAQVFTTASGRNHGYVREFGADTIIDHTKGDFVEEVRKGRPNGVDAVYDTVGPEVYARSFECLKKGGRINTIASAPKPELDEQYGVTSSYVFVRPSGEQLGEIAALVESGEIRSPAIQEFPLSEAKKAHAEIETGRTRGKIVLKVA